MMPGKRIRQDVLAIDADEAGSRGIATAGIYDGECERISECLQLCAQRREVARKLTDIHCSHLSNRAKEFYHPAAGRIQRTVFRRRPYARRVVKPQGIASDVGRVRRRCTRHSLPLSATGKRAGTGSADHAVGQGLLSHYGPAWHRVVSGRQPRWTRRRHRAASPRPTSRPTCRSSQADAARLRHPRPYSLRAPSHRFARWIPAPTGISRPPSWPRYPEKRPGRSSGHPEAPSPRE